MPKSKNVRKKPKRRRSSSSGGGGGGGMLSLRSTMKRAAGTAGGASPRASDSGTWSIVATVVILAIAAAIAYFRFLR